MTATIGSQMFSLDMPTNGGVSICLIGASRAGKTTLLKHIYREYFKNHISVMFSMNDQAQIYRDLPRRLMICPDYVPTIIGDMYKMNNKCNNKFDFLVITDDCVGHKIKNDDQITKALTIYRNTAISTIASFQGRVLMNAVGRANCNFICIFKQNTPKEIKNVIEEYLDNYLPLEATMAEKIQYFMEATRNFQFFVIDTIQGKCYLTKLSPEQAGLN